MTYPDGEVVNYAYYRQMALDRVYSSLGTYVANSTYTAAGQLDTRVLGAASDPRQITLDYSYYPWDASQGQGNSLGRLQQIQATASSGSPSLLQQLLYTYEADGNVHAIVDVVNSYQRQCFTYDQLDRLTHAWTGQNIEGCSGSAGAGPYNESYSYDAYGRLSNKTNTGTLTYDTTQEHAVDTTGVGGVYHYDANGNMDQSKKTPSSTQYSFSYDSENRLVGVSGGSLTASFVYDGNGQRVKSVIGTTTTYFVGGYYEVSGSTIKKYYYAGGQRVAMRQNGGLYFLLGDHLGSTSVSYKADGTQYITQRYKPWGELRPNGLNALLTKFTYTGQYSHVDDFGLMFYQSRWYDPSLGRFTQADTIVPGMWNPGAFDRYAYVLNNPMRWVDPSGFSACGYSWSDPECNELDDWWIPSGSDPNQIRTEKGKSGVSGQDILDAIRISGADPIEFIVEIIRREMGGLEGDGFESEFIAWLEALTRNFWEFAKTNCLGPCSFNVIANYWAGYSESVAYYVRDVLNGGSWEPKSWITEAQINKARKAFYTIVNPEANAARTWSFGKSPNRPFQVGNLPDGKLVEIGGVETLIDKEAEWESLEGLATNQMFTVVYNTYQKNPQYKITVVWTPCQADYWSGYNPNNPNEAYRFVGCIR